MSLLNIVVTCAFIFQATSIDPAVAHFRTLMQASRSSASSCSLFLKETEKVDAQAPPLMIGFKAMAQLLYCDHTNNVYSKYAYFKKGRELLETALAKEPGNAELVYFRFTTQSNAPSFLGYRDNLPGDKKYLISYLQNYDRKLNPDVQLYAAVKAYLLSSKECNASEKKLINLL